jgi:hypothetical protein
MQTQYQQWVHSSYLPVPGSLLYIIIFLRSLPFTIVKSCYDKLCLATSGTIAIMDLTRGTIPPTARAGCQASVCHLPNNAVMDLGVDPSSRSSSTSVVPSFGVARDFTILTGVSPCFTLRPSRSHLSGVCRVCTQVRGYTGSPAQKPSTGPFGCKVSYLFNHLSNTYR